MERTWKAITIAALSGLFLLLLGQGLAGAQQQGYLARPCGFDMDDDGIVGEASDCNVCDGGASQDVDGDTDVEDEVYVDCNSGNDSTGNGTSGSPYRTLSKAISVLDGAADGEEDIICVRATCAEYNQSASAYCTSGSQCESGTCTSNRCTSGGALSWTKSGVANSGPGGNSYRTKTASGNEGWNFRYPADPVMVVGWDTDDDGEYPPYDTDQPEPAIFDACQTAGCPTAQYSTFMDFNGGSHVEFAHLTIKNYGRSLSGGSIHAFEFDSPSSDQSHIFFHDIVLQDVGRGAPGDDGNRVVSWNSSNATNGWNYVAFENVHWLNNGVYQMRGYNQGGGYLRLDRIFFDNQAYNTTWPNASGVRMWSHNHLEAFNSRFVMGALAEDALQKRAFEMSQLSQDIHIAGNYFLGYTIPISTNVHDDGGFGRSGPLTVVGNIIEYPDNSTDLGETIVGIGIGAYSFDGQERTECDGGCTAGTTGLCAEDPTGSNGRNMSTDCDCDRPAVNYIEDVTITDNYIDFNDMTDLGAAIYVNQGSNCAGQAGAGPFTIANNTIRNFHPGSTANSRAAISIGYTAASQAWDWKYITGSANVHNNIVEGAEFYALSNWKRGNNNLGPLSGANYYVPGTTFFADKNVYRATSGALKFNLGGTTYTGLTAWRAALDAADSGDDAEENNSLTCTVSYASDGYHLASGDTCAKDAGDNTNCSTSDIDGNSRPINTTCDIGADELVVSAPPGSVQLSAASHGVTEGASTVTINVTRTAGSSGAATVNYGVAAITATGCSSCNGTGACDYVNTLVAGTGCTGGVCSWGDGDSATKSFSVTLCTDSAVEGSESFAINLSGATGAGLGSPSTATITITDDDDGEPPVISGPAYTSNCPSGTGTTVTVANVDGVPAGAGPDRALIVAVSATADYNAGNPNDPNCDVSLNEGTAVSWNGTYLTRMVSRVDNNGPTYSECVALFGLLNPPDVVSNVVVTFPGTVRTRNASAFVIQGVEQVLPLTGPNAEGTIGSPATRSLSVTTTAPNSAIIDVLGLGNRVNSGLMLEGAGQVQLAEISCGTTGNHMQMTLKSQATAGATTMQHSWTTGTPERYAHAAVVWPPAPTPPTTNAPTTTTSTTTTNTNTTTTTVAACGNGTVDVGEECDCVGACSAAELDNKKCSNFAPLAEGTLGCNVDCTFDFSACSRTTRGRVGVLRALGWCEASAEPACGGTCPVGMICTDVGATCECQ